MRSTNPLIALFLGITLTFAVSACPDESQTGLLTDTNADMGVDGTVGDAGADASDSGSDTGLPTGFGAACPDDGIANTFAYELNAQEDVVALMGCTSITGSLYVGTSAPAGAAAAVTDLSALSALTRIGGELKIMNTTALKSLKGLENLETIDWHLDIVDNAALADIAALNGVTAVGGDLWVRRNAMLDTCAAQALETQLGSGLAGSAIVEDNLGSCVSAQVTFKDVLAGVIQPASCNNSYCHGSAMGFRENLLAAKSDKPLCNPSQLVKPGDPEGSLLWRKIAPGEEVCGAKMPMGGEPLSQTQTDLVYQWILQGAL